MSLRLRALTLASLALCWSCQKVTSRAYEYSAELPRTPLTLRIGIADLLDDRAPLDLSGLSFANQAKAKKHQGSIWGVDRFGGLLGVTHGGSTYTPLSRVLRDLAAEELAHAGVQAVPLDDDPTDFDALMRAAKAQGLSWVVLGKINTLQAKEVPHDTPAKKFARGAAVALFIVVVVVIWVALMIASNGNTNQGPGLLGKKKRGPQGKHWENRVELSFWLCSPTLGCVWKRSFEAHEQAATGESIFSALVSLVLQQGLNEALQQLQQQAPTSVPSSPPSSVPSQAPLPTQRLRPLLLGFCGDRKIDAGEVCDDGNNNGNDGCSADCKRLELLAGLCGNGVVDDGEDCDAGAFSTPTTCRPDCKAPTCGDGVVDVGEDCDDKNLNDDDLCQNNCLAKRRK